jgi:hypothetical protein
MFAGHCASASAVWATSHLQQTNHCAAWEFPKRSVAYPMRTHISVLFQPCASLEPRSSFRRPTRRCLAAVEFCTSHSPLRSVGTADQCVCTSRRNAFALRARREAIEANQPTMAELCQRSTSHAHCAATFLPTPNSARACREIVPHKIGLRDRNTIALV